MLEYNKIPEGMPTADEMWAKLTGNKTVTYETEQVYAETDSFDLKKAMNRLAAKLFGKE